MTDEPTILHRWTARNVQPVVIPYVVAVFLGFMALAFFVFHSPDAVKALAAAGFGSLVAMVPSILGKTEYELTGAGLRKRPLNARNPRVFKEVFSWEGLDHVIPIRDGFKYFRPMESNNAFVRFWKAHISGAFSGEFHVEPGDRERVLGLLADHGIPHSKPT